MASALVALIGRIRGMVASGKPSNEITPFWDTLTERAEALENHLLALKEQLRIKRLRDALRMRNDALAIRNRK